MSFENNYYLILGVDLDASPSEIRSAFRRRAHQWHPDKNPGNKKAEDAFKLLGEAYQTLGDAEKRNPYYLMFLGKQFCPQTYAAIRRALRDIPGPTDVYAVRRKCATARELLRETRGFVPFIRDDIATAAAAHFREYQAAQLLGFLFDSPENIKPAHINKFLDKIPDTGNSHDLRLLRKIAQTLMHLSPTAAREIDLRPIDRSPQGFHRSVWPLMHWARKMGYLQPEPDLSGEGVRSRVALGLAP